MLDKQYAHLYHICLSQVNSVFEGVVKLVAFEDTNFMFLNIIYVKYIAFSLTESYLFCVFMFVV